MSNKDIAIKLHRQFAHPSKGRLIDLINKAGDHWSQNSELIQEVNDISDNCDICKKYKKTPARPVVGLPMASSFLETVALDLKDYKGNLIIHLIDLCTRLSCCTDPEIETRDDHSGHFSDMDSSVRQHREVSSG